MQICIYAFLGLITSVRIDGSLSIYTLNFESDNFQSIVPIYMSNTYTTHTHHTNAFCISLTFGVYSYRL